ncbi:hypothetical protein C1H76_8632 [Elsinoe australis]|uniref:F-box domain-containing protein n=1 Tax=Elsinoe australis TaxID=40998 RepID=A0A4U7AUE5_9PEZI|nr:hypothetical protein C1H76_8632 [Elsinoe australis]
MAANTSPRNFKVPKYMDIPGRSLQFSAPAITTPQAMTGGRGGMGLPLNIVSLIIAQLDDLADVSRLCRTSRLLYYMTLPKLYETVTLRSYLEARRVNGRVEGLGGGSPITMALGALATSQCASVVESLTLQGSWKETDDYMVGRIPDSTMLLSIAIRAAIDKTVNMQSFTWKLNTKPMRATYQGLTLRPSLTSFTLDFPISRTPRPIAVIPPIPSLKHFTVLNLDPLCYNDDISQLLFGSRNLQTLNMHWNPRMRLEAECSANLNTYFGRCIQNKYKIGVRKIGLQNFYGPNHGQLHAALDQNTIISAHYLDMFGGAHGSRTNVFVDDTWRRIPAQLNFRWVMHRSNELAPQHTRILRGFQGLIELYLVSKSLGAVPPPPAPVDSPTALKTTTSPQLSHNSPDVTASNAPSPDRGVYPGSDIDNLGAEYLDAILSSHGSTLRSLLLFDSFGLDETLLADLSARAPHVEHLGVALEGSENVFRQLIPSLPHLKSLRILENELIRKLGVFEEQNLIEVCKEFGRQIYRCGNERLRWVGIGDLVFRVGRPEKCAGRAGAEEWRCPLVEAQWEDVRHIGIWGMDNLEL